MRKLTDYTDKKDVFEVSLGRRNDGGYVCTNISQADMFVWIMPKLCALFKNETMEVQINPGCPFPVYQTVVNFYGSDNEIVATYKVGRHDSIVFGRSSDRLLFTDKCRELSRGVLDFGKFVSKV